MKFIRAFFMHFELAAKSYPITIGQNRDSRQVTITPDAIE